jgi:sodium/hydrogen antiporter
MFIVFYFLLAIFSVGVGSTLGSDNFLVAFAAGIGLLMTAGLPPKLRLLDSLSL